MRRERHCSLWVLEYHDEIHLSFLQGRKDITCWVFPHEAAFPALWILSGLTASLWIVGLEQGTALHMQPDKHWVEQDDHVSIRASNAPTESAQNPACLCCCSSALLARVLLAHWAPQALFSEAAPQDPLTGRSPYLDSLVMALVCHWLYFVGQLQVKSLAS